jgi:hypothetical protein
MRSYSGTQEIHRHLQNRKIYYCVHKSSLGRDGVVRIATCCGLDGRGSSTGEVEIFRARPNSSWGPPSLVCNRCQVSFLGVKRPGRGIDPSPQSSTEVKERVELYSSPSLGLHGLFYREIYKTRGTLFHTTSPSFF